MPVRLWGTFFLYTFLLVGTACRTAALPTLVAPAATPVAPIPSPTADAADGSAADATPAPLVVTVTATAPAPALEIATPPATTRPRTHTVAAGETVSAISSQYGVSVDALVAANNLANPDSLSPGDTLTIPDPETAPEATAAGAGGSLLVAPLATSVPLTVSLQSQPADWPPSRTDADPENYPLVIYSPSGALRIHYQPGTFPEATMGNLAPRVDEILYALQQQMGGFLDRPVDIYLAGTLFANSPSLQGLSVSRQYRTTVLVNGAFHAGEDDYIIGHELTHVAATNLFGHASSTMIHEGLATYLPQSYLQEAGYLSIHEICAAAQQANAFVPASTLIQYAYERNEFGGHIRTFLHYNLAGCFTGYLIERFGMEKMDALYDSGNYYAVYGISFAQLDREWQEWLSGVEVRVDPQAYIAMINELKTAYQQYMWASSEGYHANYLAYLVLNRARLATHQGLLDEARNELDLFWSLFGA